jgi:hypothetical protein
MGRRPIGKKAMTAAERMRRWRQRHPKPLQERWAPGDRRALERRISDALGLVTTLQWHTGENTTVRIRCHTFEQLDDVIRRLGA